MASGLAPTGHLAERLERARRRRFVGRAAEVELVREALTRAEAPFAALFLHGPGGVGKSALLARLAQAAAEEGVPSTRLDLRGIEPSPPAFAAALGLALPLEGPSLPGHADRHLLLLDTYESAAPLDGWLRERFLPALGPGALVVIAGRDAPGPGWREDPGWQELLRVVSLRNLPPGDAADFLARAEVPPELHARMMELTHGHPLALALLVEALDGRSDALPETLVEAPDLVRRLLERFAAEVPTPRHRRALQVCAQARLTTEGVLRAAAGPADAGDLLAWLRTLPFVEEGARGVFPHDLARDVLAADLRWRDPEGHAELHRRVHDHVVDRVEAGDDDEAVADLVFLHRDNPFTAAYWEWGRFGQAYSDRLRPGDRTPLLAMAGRHEGPESCALVEHWLERQPAAFIVFRAAGEEPIGFATLLALHEAAPADRDADPGARAMWEYVQRHAPTRPGEPVYGARFFMDRDAYQEPSLSFNCITVAHTQHLFRQAERAWDVIGPWSQPERMAPLMDYLQFHRAEGADYEVGGRRYGAFAHDWRRMGLTAWIEATADNELAAGYEPGGPPAVAPVLALSQPEFTAAVRAALRDLHRPGALDHNALLRCRVVRDRAAAAERPADVLVELVEEAAAGLRADPRDEKLHRALARTYLRPAPTQEAAAEALGLPFSTYRRHLARAVERLCESLWELELYGG